MINMQTKLNREQRQAATTGRDRACVIAGAGSGKTLVMVERVKYLILSGVPADRILTISFTNKAMRELRSRLKSALGKTAKDVSCCTFHSFFFKLVVANYAELGFTEKPRVDPKQTDGLLKWAFSKVCTTEDEYLFDKMREELASMENNGYSPEDASSEESEKADVRAGIAGFSKFYSLYITAAKKKNVVSFDDILLYAYLLLSKSPAAANAARARYEHILVDEYQDTNPVQSRCLDAIRPHNLFVVGDPRQAIYGFRGATSRNMTAMMKEENTQVLYLHKNYRSTASIANAANGIFSGVYEDCVSADGRKGQRVRVLECADNIQEARLAVREVREAMVGGRNVAVIARTNRYLDNIDKQLARAHIKHSRRGGTFLEKREIRNIIACMRLMADGRDEASFRTILLCQDGIGPTTIDRVINSAKRSDGDLFDEEPDYIEAAASYASSSSGEKAQRLLCFIEEFRYAADDVCSPSVAIERGRAFIGKDLKNSQRERLNDLRAWAEAWEEENEKGTIADFIDSLLLDGSNADDDVQKDCRVVLSTIHCAKGLEFDTVIGIGLTEGVFPRGDDYKRASDEEDEEEGEEDLNGAGGGENQELNCFYVLCTRAKEALRLFCPKKVYMFGKTYGHGTSSFVDKLAI